MIFDISIFQIMHSLYLCKKILKMNNFAFFNKNPFISGKTLVLSIAI